MKPTPPCSTHLIMPSRRSRKGPSPRTSAGAPARKPSKSDWKSPDQLGYLNSHLSRFISFQTAGALTRFWPRVFDGWHKQWPITPSPDDIRQYGSRENAILTLRSTTNTVCIVTCFYLYPYSFPLTAGSHVVPQPGSSHRQVLKSSPATHPKRQSETRSRPGLLCLCLGLWP